MKVLDFGLAKFAQLEVTDNVDDDVTAIIAAAPTTGLGAILGTAAYMSPEQARGRAVDKRTDIWAFGCVLYEMLARRPAFKRDDVADTLAAVLRQDVDWTALPASTPSAVRRLTGRCLERDLRRRLRDVGEARIVLEDAAAFGSRDNQDVPATTVRQPLWRRAMPIVIGALVTAALTSGATLYLTRSQARPIVTRVPLTLGEGEVFPGGTRQFVAISPDGAQIAYVVNGRGLYLRSMGTLEARLIAAGEFNSMPLSPVFSPDSGSVAFWSEQAIKRVSVGGGAAVTICPAEQQPFGITWIGGAIVFGAGSRGIMRVADTGGTPENIVSVQASEEAHGPQVLPGGDTVLFTLATGTGRDRWDKAQIVAQSLGSGQRTILVAGGSDGRYMPTGHLVFARQGVLLAVPMSLSRLQVTGGAVPIVEGVRRAQQNATGAAQFSVASTGSLVYVPGPLARPEDYFDLALIDRRGSVQPVGLPPGFYQHPRVSPNGKQIAFTIDDEKDVNVWVYELASATSPRRLTNGGNNRLAIWSADGERIVFQSDRDGAPSLFWQRADGISPAERLTNAEQGTSHVPDAWLPGAERLLFEVTRGSSVALWSLSVPDKKGTPIPGAESSIPFNASFSPDGQWVAYSIAEGAGSMIYVQPFPVSSSGAKYPLSSRGLFPVWSRKGRELVSQPPGGQWAIHSIITEPSFRFSRPVQVSRGGSITNAGAASCGEARPDPTPCNWRSFDTTPDGGFVGVVLAGQAASVGSPRAQIQVVINWFEELKARVPSTE